MGKPILLDRKHRIRRYGMIAITMMASAASAAVTVYLAVFLKQNWHHWRWQPSANPLLSNQNIDQAQFDSFGPHLEPLWRATLICNLILVFMFSLYMAGRAAIRSQYYVLIVYTAFMFTETVLSLATEYYSVPYRLASLIFFVSAIVGHIHCHFMRLDILDEMNAIKQNNRQ